jgi:hypothetical protein
LLATASAIAPASSTAIVRLSALPEVVVFICASLFLKVNRGQTQRY